MSTLSLQVNRDQGCRLGVVVADSSTLAKLYQWVAGSDGAASSVHTVETTRPGDFDAYAILVAPGVGVDEQLHRWVAAAGNVPCLVIAPYDDPLLMQAALDAGVVDFLPAVETDARRFARALRFASQRQVVHAQVLEREKLLFSQRERDRHQLATALHDGPLQDLIGARFLLGASVDGAQNPQIGEVQNSLQSVMKVLRQLCSDLKPPALEPFGLEKAMRAVVHDAGKQQPTLNIALDLDEDRQLLPLWVRLSLFRIFQKALCNVIYHAEATHAWIQLRLDEDRVRLTIADDGRGFVVPGNLSGDWLEFARNGQYGLLGMYERVDALRGRFVVQSTPGSGTRIWVDIPRDQPAGVTAQWISSPRSALNRNV